MLSQEKTYLLEEFVQVQNKHKQYVSNELARFYAGVHEAVSAEGQERIAFLEAKLSEATELTAKDVAVAQSELSGDESARLVNKNTF